MWCAATPTEVARAAARLFVDWAWQSIARDGQFHVALSGGTTPQATVSHAGQPANFAAQVDWPRVQLFWGDERAVPPDDPESNYGMARRELLAARADPAAPTSTAWRRRTRTSAAPRTSMRTLLRAISAHSTIAAFPIFHLVFLGMGTDGHTASLFPGSRLLKETSRWVSTPMVAKLGMRRMTLTLPVLDAAQRVVFLVAGSDKAAILREVLLRPSETPCRRRWFSRWNGERIFLVDEAAAALLGPWSQARPNSLPARHQPPRAEGLILAGDIGGTKCNLALLEQRERGLQRFFGERLSHARNTRALKT